MPLSRRPCTLVALASCLVGALPAAAEEPVFLVGSPVSSYSQEMDRLLARAYCRAAPEARRAMIRSCEKPGPAPSAEEQARAKQRLSSRMERVSTAAAAACVGDQVAKDRAAEVAALAQALSCLPRNEAMAPPSGPAAGLLRSASLESTLVNGLADFVVDRARAEAVDFALDQVSEVLCQEEKARRLFPSLCALSRAADQVRISLVPGSLFRDAVVADLRALALNLATAAEADSALVSRYPLSCGLRIADGVVRGLERREPPLPLAVAAIERLASECSCAVALGWRKDCPAAGPAAIERTPRAEALISAARLALASAAEGSTAPLELAATAADIDRRLEEARPDLEEARKVVGQLVGPALRLRQAFEAFQQATGEGRRDATRELIAAAVDFVGAALDGALALQGDAPAVQEARHRVAAVTALARHLLAGEYSAGIAALLASGLVDPAREPYGSLLRMASLAVEVSAAQTSDQVAKALEAAASPQGSWRLRRKKSVWGLTARVGIAAGLEQARGVPRGVVVGLHAPVGLDASWPVWKASTAGVLLQVIDLGTLVGARVAGSAGADGARELPEAGFAQVFSPGAAFFLGLGRSPFVLSGGASWTPGVRPVETGSARSAWRFSAALGIDVPIFLW